MKSTCLFATLLLFAFLRATAGERATAVAAVTAGFVSGITVTSAGSGYTSEPVVTIAGGGGSGAVAKAILSGDKVALVLVLAAGSGYTNPPTVAIEAPPERLGLRLELAPKLTVLGQPGSSAKIEWSERLGGPWTAWTSVVVEASGTVLVDLAPGAAAKFYQAVSTTPVGPPGFVWIAPGTFMMGSPTNELWRQSNETQHLVTLTRGFWLCDHEVTQAEYVAIMGANPSQNLGIWFPVSVVGNLPVDTVTYSQAVEYCQRLTERERAAGRITLLQAYRLPTEAEWEYAARAGSTDASFNDDGASVWYNGNSQLEISGPLLTQPVRRKKPNAWGLFDMLGNVQEWCSDWYGPYGVYPITDPVGISAKEYRVMRGGNAFRPLYEIRFARRQALQPMFPGEGFRTALSVIP